MTFTSEDMRREIVISLGEHAAEFDVAAIMDALLKKANGATPIDWFETTEYWVTVAKHFKGERPVEATAEADDTVDVEYRGDGSEVIHETKTVGDWDDEVTRAFEGS